MNEEEVSIPDEDCLYFFVFHSEITYEEDKAVLKESALCNTPKTGDNKSCDWSKYHSPDQTRELRGRERNKRGEFKNPNAYFVYSHTVSQWRKLHEAKDRWPEQIVKYDPINFNPEVVGTPNNIAHTIIIGEKSDLKLRTYMARVALWRIAPPDSKDKMKVYREDNKLNS